MIVEEPALAYNKRHFTIEEYLAMEEAATEKHAYYKGEIFAMSGAKLPHNIVAANILVGLMMKLKGKPCRPYNSDTRIHVEKNSLFTYPDISIICGEPQTRNNDDYNVLNPTVIIEVLSPGTKGYDKREKFALYRDIPSLKEYVSVEPGLVNIESYFVNPEGYWELREYRNINDIFILKSIGISLPVKDIYEQTKVAGDNSE